MIRHPDSFRVIQPVQDFHDSLVSRDVFFSPCLSVHYEEFGDV